MIICTLRNLMEYKKINQSTLSEETKISRPTLLQLIRNENQNIKYDTIDELCAFFNINMNDLLLYSPIDIKFDGIEVTTFEDDFDVLKEYIVTISYWLGDQTYNFEAHFNIIDDLILCDLNNEETYTISFECEVKSSEYMNLINLGYDEEFFNSYNEVFNIRQKIIEKIPSLKNCEIEIFLHSQDTPTITEVLNKAKLLTKNEKEMLLSYLKENI